MPWAVCTSPLPIFREDEPPMSLVARNGAFLARALGDKPFCELLSPQGRFCSTWLSEPLLPRKALEEPVASCLLDESRSKPHPEAECFFSEL
jgi:hypothetical protein